MEKLSSVGNKEAIHYLEFGCREPLVLLPSLGVSSKSYKALGLKLSQKYTVFIPDIYKGKSVFHHNTKSLEDYIEKLHQLTTALRLKKFYLVGVSASGYLASQYALKYPLQILKLYLVSTTVVPFKTRNKKAWLFYSYLKLYFHNLFSSEGLKANLLWIVDGLKNLFSHPKQTMYEYLLAMSNFNNKPKRMPIPTKLLFAEKDEFISPRLFKEMEKIENLEIERVNRYHAWFFYHEDELADKIIKFFKK